MTANLGTDVLPWTMQIQNRNAESQKMYMILDGSSGSQLLLAPDRLHDAPGTPRQISLSQASGQDDSGALSPSATIILGLSLINPTNYCYSHAIVLSICWTASCLQSGMPILEPRLLRLLRWLTRRQLCVKL